MTLELVMGAFVLGILVGWLAEWLFFTFWIKGRSTGKFADCTALKTELNSKNSEIASLKVDLEKAKKTATESISTETTNKAENKVVTEVVSTATAKPAAKKAPAAKAAPKKPVAKKAAPKKASTTTKATGKKAPATKATPKKPIAKKATPKKALATKTTAKKAPVAKATPKKPAAKKAPAKKATSGDDLTRLSGIGPSMAATLSELGITSYKKLADMDDDILRDMLEASGARLNNNKEAMDTWNEQAELADKGDFDGLKKLQESLKK